MKRLSNHWVLLSFLVAVSCATHEQAPSPETEVDSIAVEVTVEDDDLSFWDVPVREKAYINTSPAGRNDGVVVGELGVDSGRKNMIVQLAQDIAEGKYGNLDSLLISQNGKLLFESYYLRGRVNMTHPQVSATKSYTALALGRAIQLGYLTMADLDKPLVSFLKDLDLTSLVEGAENITLHQALNMSSGIRISEEQTQTIEKHPNSLIGQGQAQVFLEQSAPITAESQSFLYQGSDPILVMQVIDALVPGSAEDFIKNELFQKIGITTYNWQKDVSGLPNAGARASITSRSMLKLGTLVKNHGQWKGEQLVPEAFIKKMLSRLSLTGDDDVFGGGEDVSDQGYGYFWWSADLTHGPKRYFASSAQGGGGQFIILVEELDLVIVVTAHEGDSTSLQMTAERILPAFIL